MTNIESANRFLENAKKELEAGHLDRAAAWNALADTIMQAHVADKIGLVAKAIDRLASVVNSGKSWH